MLVISLGRLFFYEISAKDEIGDECYDDGKKYKERVGDPSIFRACYHASLRHSSDTCDDRQRHEYRVDECQSCHALVTLDSDICVVCLHQRVVLFRQCVDGSDDFPEF